jgi:hypothetical protein
MRAVPVVAVCLLALAGLQVAVAQDPSISSACPAPAISQDGKCSTEAKTTPVFPLDNGKVQVILTWTNLNAIPVWFRFIPSSALPTIGGNRATVLSYSVKLSNGAEVPVNFGSSDSIRVGAGESFTLTFTSPARCDDKSVCAPDTNPGLFLLSYDFMVKSASLPDALPNPKITLIW